MNVLIVSGIWPPDMGGPAEPRTGARRVPRRRGHGVQVVTTASTAPAPESYPVHFVPRSRPPGVRHALVAWYVRAARAADVVYATSMIRRSAAGAAAARRPLVVKLVADEAYERATRSGRFGGTLEEFQQLDGGVRIRALRQTRNAAVGRAVHVFCPSAYLREIAVGWGPARGADLGAPEPRALRPGAAGQERAARFLGMTGGPSHSRGA